MKANKKQTLYFALCSPWNCLPGFEKVLNVEVNGLADIRECFLIAVAPAVATLERWTGGVPGVPAVLEFIGLDGHFENVGFHWLYASRGTCPPQNRVSQIISRLRNTRWLELPQTPRY
jgi:hypothetical protein